MVWLYESVENRSTQFLFPGYQISKARRGREEFMTHGTMEPWSTRVSATERTPTFPSIHPSFPSTSMPNNSGSVLLCFIYLLILEYCVLANGMLHRSVHPTDEYLSMKKKPLPPYLEHLPWVRLGVLNKALPFM